MWVEFCSDHEAIETLSLSSLQVGTWLICDQPSATNLKTSALLEHLDATRWDAGIQLA